jgi:ankyrin repeat protein
MSSIAQSHRSIFYTYFSEKSPTAQQKLECGLTTPDLDKVKEALNHGADPAFYYEDLEAAPLAYACEKGYPTIVEELLKHRLDPNISSGLVPLSLAAHNGHYECTRELLKKKADVNFNYGFAPPLDNACHSYSITQLLLQAKADVSRGYPLHNAIGNADVVALLINAKANIEKEIAQNNPEYQGCRPVHLAALKTDKASLLLLLNARADPSPINKSGETPLILALRQRTIESLLAERLHRPACSIDDLIALSNLSYQNPLAKVNKLNRMIEILSKESNERKSQQKLYRNDLKNRFLTASAFSQNSPLRSRLVHAQWSLAPDENFEKPSCQIPDSSGRFGITSTKCIQILLKNCKQLQKIHCVHSNCVHFDPPLSKIESDASDRGRSFPIAKADKKDRFGKATAGQHAYNLRTRSRTAHPSYFEKYKPYILDIDYDKWSSGLTFVQLGNDPRLRIEIQSDQNSIIINNGKKKFIFEIIKSGRYVICTRTQIASVQLKQIVNKLKIVD